MPRCWWVTAHYYTHFFHLGNLKHDQYIKKSIFYFKLQRTTIEVNCGLFKMTKYLWGTWFWVFFFFSDPVKPLNQSIWPGGNLKLRCVSPSSLAKTTWERDGSPLSPATRLQLLRDGLLILNASGSDTGRYRCLSVERSKAGEYITTVAEYHVGIGPAGSGNGNLIFPQAQMDGPSVAGLQAVIVLLVVALLALLVWNFYKGHLPLPWNCGQKNREQSQGQGGLNSSVTYQDAPRPALGEDKPLVSGRDNSTSNNNHSGGEVAFSAAEENDTPKVSLPSLQFIDDESEIWKWQEPYYIHFPIDCHFSLTHEWEYPTGQNGFISSTVIFELKSQFMGNLQ